ncbi:MAG: nucleotide pyrophosphohydrolase [Bacteriovorax sp. MedPE-SWde]|nr:MAG: nucleotide pyrophosphohydrolase [Bacteriovorax sp. MedPE-SWde]
MKDLNVKKIQHTLEEFVKERNWDQFHSVKNLTMALSVESSELVELFQWLTTEQSNTINEREEDFIKVKEEVADIFAYLLRICDKLDIDIEEVIMDKIQKNREKYPIDKSYGLATKYNQLK